MDYQKVTIDKALTGKRIYDLIKKSNITFEQLQEFLLLNSPRVIYEWISGRKLPSTENLVNIALIISVHLESIIVYR